MADPVNTDPVIITAAINGGMQQRRDGAKVPTSPEEIAEDARLCAEAGASIVHFHGRDPDGSNTADLEVYREAINLIRERTDALIQTTNAIGPKKDPETGEMIRRTDDERRALLEIVPRPDLYGVAAGTSDFYSPDSGYGETDRPFVTSAQMLTDAIKHARSVGSNIEFEIVDTHAIMRVARYARDGLFDPESPYVWMTLACGIAYLPEYPESLIYMRDLAQKEFPNVRWTVTGYGRQNFKWATLGLALGCAAVRCGFEDSLYLANGDVAERNHHIIEQVVNIAEIFGRRPATIAETRQILGLDRKER
jgi:3-keto-5-aminohexanoate cleavage enzyme